VIEARRRQPWRLGFIRTPKPGSTSASSEELAERAGQKASMVLIAISLSVRRLFRRVREWRRIRPCAWLGLMRARISAAPCA
jgi:hypothetical protein